MKRIKIFLASSIREFSVERNIIGDIIRIIQDELIDEEIRIKLFECEYGDTNISILKRKQDEYNKIIQDSDIFIMLVGKTLGDYSKEEFNVAKSVKSIHKEIIFKNCIHDDSVEQIRNQLVDSDVYYYTNDLELFDIILSIVFSYLKEYEYQFINDKLRIKKLIK